MEEILRKLSELQIKAMNKGISFDIDLSYNSKNVPSALAKLQYSVAGDIVKGYVFETTFSETLSETKKQSRINSIEHFISTATE